MTADRTKAIEGVITATRILKLQSPDETIVQAAVRMGDELSITSDEVEEVLAKMDGKKVEDKKIEGKKVDSKKVEDKKAVVGLALVA